MRELMIIVVRLGIFLHVFNAIESLMDNILTWIFVVSVLLGEGLVHYVLIFRGLIFWTYFDDFDPSFSCFFLFLVIGLKDFPTRRDAYSWKCMGTSLRQAGWTLVDSRLLDWD
ncbi:hypothetical protein ACHAWF_015485 [Thalassiosira exigua]